jgi:Arc/MetJ-type ribon-helix-helix transcriptional regulator
VPRIRSIKPELFEDEALGECSRDARLLFVGLISHSDDEGRQRAAPRKLLGYVFPFDEEVSSGDVRGWLEELEGWGLVQLYDIRGQSFLQIRNWTKHQRVEKPRPSSIPPPPRLADGNFPATLPTDKDKDKDKEEDKDKENGYVEASELIREAFAYWQTHCKHPQAKLTSDRRAKMVARVHEGRTLDEFKRAIDGAVRGAFVNADGKRFDDIELICRTGSKFEDFMGRLSQQTVPDARQQRRERSAQALERLQGT